MRLHQLPKITDKPKKRVGRGLGTGKGGHTVGRGQKGQKTRGKIGPLFEGTKVKKSLIKRLPLLRGKGKLKPKPRPLAVKLDSLNRLSRGTTVDIKNLISAGLADTSAEKLGVKILGVGELKKKLTVAVRVTGGARTKIEKAGGKILS